MDEFNDFGSPTSYDGSSLNDVVSGLGSLARNAAPLVSALRGNGNNQNNQARERAQAAANQQAGVRGYLIIGGIIAAIIALVFVLRK